jgi:hypothetical protein
LPDTVATVFVGKLYVNAPVLLEIGGLISLTISERFPLIVAIATNVGAVPAGTP